VGEKIYPYVAGLGRQRADAMTKKLLFFCIFFYIIFPLNRIFCEEPASSEKKEPVYVGSFFDVQVPIENYYFIKGVLTVFGNKYGQQPKTPEDEERAIWDNLLLSYEAFKRQITIGDEEIEREIAKILNADKVSFDWKKDADAYEKWLKDKVNEPPKLFENQIRHLLQVERLREQVMAGIEPPVNDKEALQEFLNEHNSLNVELVEFNEKKDAELFYKKTRSSLKSWDEEKNIRPKDFRRPGYVSLEFLIDIWKFPKEDVYKMVKMKKDTIYPPAPIYKGYGVFRILEAGPADEKEFKRVKTSYYEQIRRRKKYEGLDRWFGDFRKQANIKIYPSTIPAPIPGKVGENKEGTKNE